MIGKQAGVDLYLCGFVTQFLPHNRNKLLRKGFPKVRNQSACGFGLTVLVDVVMIIWWVTISLHYSRPHYEILFNCVFCFRLVDWRVFHLCHCWWLVTYLEIAGGLIVHLWIDNDLYLTDEDILKSV